VTVGFLTLKELANQKTFLFFYFCHSLYCSLVHEQQAIKDPLLAHQTKSQDELLPSITSSICC
jgi:hypothetical protein